MTKFIKVNEIGNNVLHINVDKIIVFKNEPPSKAGKCMLQYHGDKERIIYVKETAEELIKLINAK